MIRHAATTPSYLHVDCLCGARLYERPPYAGSLGGATQEGTPAAPSAAVAAVHANPIAMAQRKELKRKLRECNASHRAKVALVREHIQQFKLETDPLLQQVRAIRKVHIDAISGAEETKVAQSTFATLRYAYTKFKCKYTLDRYEMRELGVPFFRHRYYSRYGVRAFRLNL